MRIITLLSVALVLSVNADYIKVDSYSNINKALEEFNKVIFTANNDCYLYKVGDLYEIRVAGVQDYDMLKTKFRPSIVAGVPKEVSFVQVGTLSKSTSVIDMVHKLKNIDGVYTRGTKNSYEVRVDVPKSGNLMQVLANVRQIYKDAWLKVEHNTHSLVSYQAQKVQPLVSPKVQPQEIVLPKEPPKAQEELPKPIRDIIENKNQIIIAEPKQYVQLKSTAQLQKQEQIVQPKDTIVQPQKQEQIIKVQKYEPKKYVYAPSRVVYNINGIEEEKEQEAIKVLDDTQKEAKSTLKNRIVDGKVHVVEPVLPGDLEIEVKGKNGKRKCTETDLYFTQPTDCEK